MKAYLDTSALCEYLSCSRDYINKKIRCNDWRLGVHFVQPDGVNTKRRFIREKIDEWMLRNVKDEVDDFATIMAQKLAG
jgi:hypothetical protein